jgi:hypothetical protein
MAETQPVVRLSRPVLASGAVNQDKTFTDRRPSIAGSALIAALFAAGIILASSRGHVGAMTYGDGLIYRYVAQNFAQPPAEVHPVVVERGTSLRYGRVGLPAVIWVASAGRPEAMRYTQPVVIVLSAAAAGAAAALLMPGAGGFAPILLFLAPGFSIGVAGGFAEVLAVALGLWAVVLAERGRWPAATAALAGAILTRENAGAILLGILVWYVFIRREKRALVLLLSLVPVGIWYAFIDARYGHIPILDPYLRVATDTIAPPFIAVWRSLTSAPAGPAFMAAIHVVLMLLAFALWRRSVFGAIAAAAGLQVLSAGRFSWHFAGEAARAFTFLQLFLILAIAGLLLQKRTPPLEPVLG